MNIRDLDFFIKVYECRSISIASEKLFISAQGLSNVISRLEQELGCSLFNRDRAGSVPTACGDVFYKYAVNTKSEYERMITEIEHLSRAEKGVIRIGYSFGVMSGLTMNITQEFQNKMREIADEPLTLRNRNFATTRIMMQEFEKYGADPEIMLNTGGILRSLKLRKDGMANTVIIDSVAAQIESDEMRTIPFTEELKWPLYIITKKGRGRSKAVDRFISFITENRSD